MRGPKASALAACLAFLAISEGNAESQTTAPAPKSGALYARIKNAYMDGDWAELEKALNSPAAELAALAPTQQADVKYVRQAMAECRQEWWKLCKTGRKGVIQPIIWGKGLIATFDPNGQSGMQFRTNGKELWLTLRWDPNDMDSTANGEYGFLKGDLAGLGIWHTLGTCHALKAALGQIPANATEKDNLRMSLYLDFWGNIIALYYADPPARRWGLHIYLAAYMEKYGKGPMAASRRAAAAVFLTEVLSSPAKYPSLKLPDKLAAESAEESLAVYLKPTIGRKTHWTIAEDKAFREALKAFAAANDQKVLQGARVALPNGLTFAMLPDEDTPFRQKRDAWVKAQFDKAGGNR